MALPGWLTVVEPLSADTFITQAVVFAQGADTWLVAVPGAAFFTLPFVVAWVA